MALGPWQVFQILTECFIVVAFCNTVWPSWWSHRAIWPRGWSIEKTTSATNIGKKTDSDPLCSYSYRALWHPTSAIVKEQTGNVFCVSANIQLPAYIRGLWGVAREIQTNDMSIRIRFYFLVSPSALRFTLWDFFFFWIWNWPLGNSLVLDSEVGAPHTNRPSLIRWRVPKFLSRGICVKWNLSRTTVAQMSQRGSSLAKLYHAKIVQR